MLDQQRFRPQFAYPHKLQQQLLDQQILGWGGWQNLGMQIPPEAPDANFAAAMLAPTPIWHNLGCRCRQAIRYI